ncbi:MAG: FAD-dependent oxidoreductase [Cyclobacteriaceae bacterium]
MKNIFLFLFVICFFSCQQTADQSGKADQFSADVIVYGGTSAAVTAAVEVVRSGKSVIVVSPDIHLGGLSSGGLGFTDTGKKDAIGGLSREFYQRIYNYYDVDSTWKWQKKSEYGNKGQGTPAIDGANRTMWIFEPHIAENVFEDFVSEHDIKVYRDEWLDRSSGVESADGKIIAMTTLSGKRFEGKVFMDATYEGDLMAAANVSYHVGRESMDTYGEKWNGVQTGVLHHQHWFWEDISPYVVPGDPSSGVLPKISTEDPGEYGAGDDKIQAYCFRTCMSNHPDNRVPFPKPDNYDPKDYELLGRVFDTGRKDWFQKFDVIPNRKTDTNNHGPFSSDNIGMNYDYPEASYERRKEIIKEHEDYQKGLLYYVANDPRVPEDIQSKMNEWGLAKDEFVDNGNWPHQIYVREARRMIGQFVTTEHEVLGKRDVKDPVGMGSYAMDSHNIQRYIKKDGFVQNEGDIGVAPDKPYQISFGSIVPKKEECTNLVVPVCVSSSHIAFGSIRMEPVFMILGQSAAVTASMAIDNNAAVQDVNYDKLKEALLAKGQVLSLD